MLPVAVEGDQSHAPLARARLADGTHVHFGIGFARFSQFLFDGFNVLDFKTKMFASEAVNDTNEVEVRVSGLRFSSINLTKEPFD